MGNLGSLDWKKFEKFLFSVGCNFTREKGDHRIYWKKGIKRPIVIPRYRQLPAFIVLNNLRILGVSKEELLSFLQK